MQSDCELIPRPAFFFCPARRPVLLLYLRPIPYLFITAQTEQLHPPLVLPLQTDPVPSLSSPFSPAEIPKGAVTIVTSLHSDESGIISGVQGFCSSGLTVFVTKPLNH